MVLFLKKKNQTNKNKNKKPERKSHVKVISQLMLMTQVTKQD